MNSLRAVIKNIFSNRLRAALIIILILVVGFFGYGHFKNSNQAPSYQTSQAEKGSLVISISASGTISSGNSISITTQSSGVVNQVFVKDGDSVQSGDQIAEITLDQASQQKQTAAWANYLQAKNSLDSANTTLYTLQNTEFVANQKLINDAVARHLTVDDPTYIEENATWLAAEASYKNQQSVIAASQASLSSSWLSYAQLSSIVTAPSSGKVTGLTLTPGMQVTQSSSTTTTSSATLGSVSVEGPIQGAVNLSEIDVVKVKIGDKVSLTMDAFPDKSFTGKVATINTTGSVSSGVVSYPTTIVFDTGLDNIYPNMAITAKIITSVKNDVVLVPSAAVQTISGQSTVRELKNGQLTSVTVEVGDSNDTQTEIISGVNEGDEVVTSVTNSGTRSTGATTSPFGGGFGRGFGGGGGNAVIRRGN